MQNMSVIGVVVALGCGIMVVIQSTFFAQIGRAIGPTRTSLVLNVTGGILAEAIVLAAIGIQGLARWNIPRSALLTSTISVAMGIFIIMGIAYSFQRMGVAAGIATLFLGQMLVGVIADVYGPLPFRKVRGGLPISG